MKTSPVETRADAENGAGNTEAVSSSQIIDHTTIDPHYITGLCDGQASFTYIKNGNSINLRFSLKVQEPDRDLLFSLMRFFGVGNIYRSGPVSSSSSDKGGNWHYCVTKISEIGRIIEHFELYPLAGRKASVFSIWKSMFDLKKVPRKVDLEALSGLAARLSEISRRRSAAEDRRMH